MRHGSQLGQRMTPLVHRTLLGIYERHRQHVWTEDSISHAEAALERAGLYQRVSRPPAVCFVDLTGFTSLTEEQGDEVAARIAASLVALVEDISRRHGGRPVRWLGDGGMFLFKEPTAGIGAALEIAERAPGAGLPPTHIGIHAGPVILYRVPPAPTPPGNKVPFSLTLDWATRHAPSQKGTLRLVTH
jgi:class 3 adenylate cyclase